MVILLANVQAQACNFTKSITLPWCFSYFLNGKNGTKLHKASHVHIVHIVQMFIFRLIEKQMKCPLIQKIQQELYSLHKILKKMTERQLLSLNQILTQIKAINNHQSPTADVQYYYIWKKLRELQLLLASFQSNSKDKKCCCFTLLKRIMSLEKSSCILYAGQNLPNLWSTCLFRAF